MIKNLVKFPAALILYAGLALYLYQPYLNNFNRFEYLLPVNACIAASGCFVLSRRWVGPFASSLFAGAMYGFGPFALGLTRYHPTAGLLAAAVPWLFCPAALGPKGRRRWLSWLLLALPVLAILLFFQMTARLRLFAVPIQAKLHLADLPGLLAPLVMVNASLPVAGFYHVPIAALVMGLCMLLAARRFGIMAMFVTAAALAFCDSLFGVSPLIWLSVPVLCCSVLIGAGMQGLVLAGWADRKWVLLTFIIMAVLSVGSLLLAVKYAGPLTETAKMYILGAVAVAVIFFLARAKLRLRWLALLLLGLAMAADIFIGARFIVDKIF